MEIKYKSKRQEIFFTEFLPSIICIGVCLIVFLILNAFPLRFPQRYNCFSSAAMFLITPLFYLVFKLRFPPILKIIGYSFIFLGMLLATAMNLYVYVPEWDTVLHLTSGIMCFLISYYVLLYTGMLFHMKEGLVVIICLLLNAATSSIWEICEYGVDVLVYSNAQHSLEEGVVDTMQDILANTIGGLLIGVFMLIDILINHRKVTDWFTRHLSIYTAYDYRKPVPLE